MTGWLWEDFRPIGIKGKLRALEAWIEDWNREVGVGEGVKLIPLRRTAYMNLDIQIPDPQVRIIGEESRSRIGGSEFGGGGSARSRNSELGVAR